MRATRVDPACPDSDGEAMWYCWACEADTWWDWEAYGRELWRRCQVCYHEEMDDGG